MSNFIKDALRTESTVEPEYNLEQCAHILERVVSLGDVVDTLKKAAYYKKPSALAALAHVTYLPNNAKKTPNPRLLHAVLGCITESAEMAEALLKHINGGELDVVNLQEEVGDLQWYQAILLDEVGSDFETEHNRVIEKLKSRFPDKFTTEKANNRDLDAERKVLEGELSVEVMHKELEDYYGKTLGFTYCQEKCTATRNITYVVVMHDMAQYVQHIDGVACEYHHVVKPYDKLVSDDTLKKLAVTQFYNWHKQTLKGK